MGSSKLLLFLSVCSIFAIGLAWPVPAERTDSLLTYGDRQLNDQLIYNHHIVIEKSDNKCLMNVTSTVSLPQDFRATQVRLEFPKRNADAVETRLIEGLGTNRVVFNFLNRNNFKIHAIIAVFAKDVNRSNEIVYDE